MNRITGVVLACSLSFGLAYGLASLRPSTPVAPRRLAPATTRPGISWIVAGGGPTPELNQVQLEQDIELAREVFGAHGEGLVLFGGGRHGRSVQQLAPTAPPVTLRTTLGALFDPRPGRDAIYRAGRVRPDGPVSRDAILSALEGAVSAAQGGDGPVTLYLAGHGTGGELPQTSRFETWGADALWVEDLAEVLDMHDERPVRVVVTSCYGGGFAELAFRAADVDAGPAETARCGLFATDWDRVASGCDPNPDRAAQQGYGVHFLSALRGQDRDGNPDRSLDLDRDGHISLLEAHTRARIASRSLDLPITTSEVFLRAAVEEGTQARPLSIREEDVLIGALGRSLELDDEDAANARHATLLERLERLSEQLDTIDLETEAAREDYAASILHRWPELADPWHPGFAATLADHEDDIAAFMDASGARPPYQALVAQQSELAERHDALLVSLAPVERLLRAYQTRRLAGALHAEGGPLWLRYQAFLACERGHL